MSIKRRQKRAANAHFAVLAEILGRFYELLGKSPQPSDEEVREAFTNREREWKHYCSKKQLSKSAYKLFNDQVAQLWERKKAKQPETNTK